MGVGRKVPKRRAAGMARFASGGRASSADAEAYAADRSPRTSPFAQRKAAAKKQRRGQS